jgi:hypothetical protein
MSVDTNVLEEYTASPEDGDIKFLRNAGIYLEVHMELQSRRPTSTSSLL